MKSIKYFLITLCFLLLVATNGKSQNITLSVKNVDLEVVLKQFQNQSGYTVFYNDNLLRQSVKVTFSVKGENMYSALKKCFSMQPKLSYAVIGKTIVVMFKRELPATADSTIHKESTPLTDGSIGGKIFNSKYEEIGNADIIIQRTGRGTVSAADGSFRLSDIAPSDTLKISFVGYKDQYIAVGKRTEVSVMLLESDNELDEVVSQAYSKTSQRFSTGNITTVKAEDIERQPVMNPLLALQGRVPGLLVTQTNGFASAPVKLDIRGIGNLAKATDPLYIIDGVPLSVLLGGSSYGFSQSAFGGSTTSSQGSTRSIAGGESPLFSMNPNDIESISVLTGADATSIYGSRGANGVILITTKKGKVGSTRFDISATQGISEVTRYWDMLNTSQYLEMRREAMKNDGVTPTILSAPDLLLWDTTRYTNWQKALFGHSGKNTKVSTGLSGGNQQTTFRINADYNRVTDITTLSGSTQRMTLGFNI